ncbi:MAG: hypothetical protein R3F43_24430 [bacterium]
MDFVAMGPRPVVGIGEPCDALEFDNRCAAGLSCVGDVCRAP